MILTRTLIMFAFFFFFSHTTRTYFICYIWGLVILRDRGTRKELLNLIWTYGSLRKIRTYASELATRCLTRYWNVNCASHDAIAFFEWLKAMRCLSLSLSYRSHICRLEKTTGLSTRTWKENGMWGSISKEGEDMNSNQHTLKERLHSIFDLFGRNVLLIAETPFGLTSC